jgi:amylosucrase
VVEPRDEDARLAVQSLRRMATIPADTAWATYVRCHDDIGWAVSDTDAWAVGWSPFAHRGSSTTSTPAPTR